MRRIYIAGSVSPPSQGDGYSVSLDWSTENLTDIDLDTHEIIPPVLTWSLSGGRGGGITTICGGPAVGDGYIRGWLVQHRPGLDKTIATHTVELTALTLSDRGESHVLDTVTDPLTEIQRQFLEMPYQTVYLAQGDDGKAHLTMSIAHRGPPIPPERYRWKAEPLDEGATYTWRNLQTGAWGNTEGVFPENGVLLLDWIAVGDYGCRHWLMRAYVDCDGSEDCDGDSEYGGLRDEWDQSIAIELFVVRIGPIDADVVDAPPSGKTYASGINANSIVISLNGTTITAAITGNSLYSKHIHYNPSFDELNIPGDNTVGVKVRDNANAGVQEGQDINDAGNPTAPDPFTWIFTLP